MVGLGGVGGYTTEVLARSGINNFILIDFDKVEITNINRQLIALNNNLDNLKVALWEECIKLINPNANITKIDACDSLFTKQDLIKYAHVNNIKIISSMGMGNKLDPNKVKITKLSETTHDPIAKKLRKFIKTNNIEDIHVIALDEEPLKINTDFVTSNAFAPAISGILMGSYIIDDML